jgi:hypothetical protein
MGAQGARRGAEPQREFSGAEFELIGSEAQLEKCRVIGKMLCIWKNVEKLETNLTEITN